MKCKSCQWSASSRRDYGSPIQILGAQPILLNSSQDVEVHKDLITMCSRLYAVPLPKGTHEVVHEVYTDTDCLDWILLSAHFTRL